MPEFFSVLMLTGCPVTEVRNQWSLNGLYMEYIGVITH